MASVRDGRRAKVGPHWKAWTFLVAGALFLAAGLVLNKAVNPSKVSKHTVLELGGLVIVLWIMGALLLAVAVARFRRAAAKDRQEQSREAARRLASEQLADAGRLLARLLAGDIPAVEQIWDVVLRTDERALLDGRIAYSRFYGTGTSASHAAVPTTAKAGKRTRAQEVALAIGPRWRDQQQARFVVTDQRLLCQVETHGWLSFEHKVATAIKPLSDGPGVVLEYPGTSPLRLSGPGATQVMVVVIWALYGADGLRKHPALAEVRASGPALPPATTATESGISPTSSAATSAGGAVALTVSDPRPAEARNAATRSATANRFDDLLALLAANELVLVRHVAELLQVTTEEAARRLEALRKEGAVRRTKLSPRSPAVYRITPDAAAGVDRSFPPIRPPDLSRHRHDAAAAWLWVTARHGHFGQQRAILSRREMHAADAGSRTGALLGTADATFADGPSAGLSGEYRDLALVQADGGWRSVDVLLSPPSSEKLRTMLGRARRDQTLAEQMFLIKDTPRIRSAIETVTDELGLADRVVIEPLDPEAMASG